MIRRQQGGWSNAKAFAGVRRLAGTLGDDPFAAAATAAVSAGGLAAAVLLPKPGRVAIPLAAAVGIGTGWRNRLANRRVSYVVSRDLWEQRQHEVMSAHEVVVDVGHLAKAVDPDGTVHDVLVTCRRRDASAVGLALGVRGVPGQDHDQATATAATRGLT